MSSKVTNSLLSGTGFSLLHAKGNGRIAFGAYGSVHKYILTPGEIRAVDNGHLVAWSDTMNYWMNMASSSSSSTTSRRMINSFTSGEGLMCFFEGPGVVYIQSHKIDSTNNGESSASGGGGGGSRHGGNRSNTSSGITTFLVFIVIFIFMVFVSQSEYYRSVMNSMKDYNNNNNNNQYRSQDRYNDQNYRPSLSSSQRNNYKREL